jgi:hypothetical protein
MFPCRQRADCGLAGRSKVFIELSQFQVADGESANRRAGFAFAVSMFSALAQAWNSVSVGPLHATTIRHKSLCTDEHLRAHMAHRGGRDKGS